MVKSTATTSAAQLEPIALDTLEAGFSTRQISLPALRQSLIGFLANLHRSTANTKRRGQVSGGGRKPWRQKGTGRARVGSSRTPVWRGGGVVFGPSTAKNYQHDISRSLRTRSLLDALWIKLETGAVFQLAISDQPTKTKQAVDMIGVSTRPTLVVVSTLAEGKAFANLDKVLLNTPAQLNLLDLTKAHRVVFVGDAWAAFKQRIKI